MNKLRRYQRRKKEFEEFEAKKTSGKYGFKINYSFNGEKVGWMFGDKVDNYYTVAWIKLFNGYNKKGYSKFMYRDALELAQSEGLEGLLVGDSLTTEKKSRSTYQNFQSMEYKKKNSQRIAMIVLTQWLPKYEPREL